MQEQFIMHPFLQCQLLKYFGNKLPTHPEMENFQDAISASYAEVDEKNKTIGGIIQKNNEESRKNPVNKADKIETIKIELNQEELFFEHASLHVLQLFSRGKESFVIKMLHAIIDSVPPTINDLNKAIQNKDWISVNKFSHKLIPNMNMSGNSYLENDRNFTWRRKYR